MVRWSLAPKWPILVHFCGMDHQKSNFLLILAPFLSEAVEDSRCYFFENWFMKLKIYNLLKPLGTITQLNYWYIYLPLRADLLCAHHYETPCRISSHGSYKKILHLILNARSVNQILNRLNCICQNKIKFGYCPVIYRPIISSGLGC